MYILSYDSNKKSLAKEDTLVALASLKHQENIPIQTISISRYFMCTNAMIYFSNARD
jgi:hypothetical protein